MSTSELVQTMLRLLPRIYITASDIPSDDLDFGYIDQALDETSYDSVRQQLASVFGKNDSYLEVFEEDMKYSDTPIAATVSENLADLFQVFYNFIETVKDAPEEVADGAFTSVKEDFANYWSQILCNVLRQLNNLNYNSDLLNEEI